MRDQLLAAITARLGRITVAALVLEPAALDEAQRLAAVLRDDDGDLEARFVLGSFYWYRFRASPDGPNREILREAIQAFTPCFIGGVEELPEPLLPFLAEEAVGTAVSLLDQALITSDLTLITTAVSLWQRILTATPADHPHRAAYLSSLGIVLGIRFRQSGVLGDLDEAIGASREAVAITLADDPDRAGMLSNLGNRLRVRFSQSGVLGDLDEAIGASREAVAITPADDPDRAGMLSDLGNTLRVRFEQFGALTDLDEAIGVGREAVAATPVNHSGRAEMLSNLGCALHIRFERFGVVGDLDAAIDVGREAVAATPVNHPDLARCLSNLGASLRVRFGRFGALGDLDAAIDVGREAVRTTPAHQPGRAGWLSNLGVALHVRFERTGVVGDLDAAIDVGREAVAATPANHPDRARHLSNLGLALRERFERSRALTDLDEAIGVAREAVAATSANHPDRAGMLSNLGDMLRAQFRRSGVPGDLDAAIDVGRQAVATTPAEHLDQAGRLFNLGLALRERFERSGVSAALDEAISTFVQVAEVESGTPSMRIRAARQAASLGAQTSANLLERAVRLLPETAHRRLLRGDQQYALGQFAGLASDAAALALRADAPDPGRDNPATRALRLLELGRGVLLSQALDTRSELTDLGADHPALAARFCELRDQLDQPSDTTALANDAGMVDGWAQRPVEDRHRRATEFQKTVAEIRDLEGFKTFLLPPEPDQLLRHAQHGPVVLINVSQYGSDAILLTPDGITSVPLPDLDQNDLIDQIVSFHEALSTAHDPDVSSDDRIGAQHTLSAVLEWLWDTAARPILDELGYRHTPAAGAGWPRLWWVPGGLLGFLPMHAAGYHRESPESDEGRRTVLDRVISSYTPTVRALGYARERNTASSASDRALIVAMPTTPGIDRPLSHVADEAKLVFTRLSGAILLIEDLATANPALPTKATVLAHLSNCAIAHFACHGHSHPSDPSLNLLLLHDHDTDPLTVASLAPIRLDQVRLAYLSACRTAFNASTDLADEAIHLTTAFQLAGYPHVVGTLWEIDDDRAVHVADIFYTGLVNGDNTIDTGCAAQALHHAVRAIRDELPATPSLWAAYLHAGA